MRKVRNGYLMLAYCYEQSWMIPGGFSGSGGLCTPLQSKTIRNSRVLGCGRLNGHVASIMSMFSKEKVFEMESAFEKHWKEELLPERYG